MSVCCCPLALGSLLPVLDPLVGGELDGRDLDCTDDLGAEGDLIPSVSVVSIVIARQDGFPVTSADLQLATNFGWPMSLDPTRLIVNVGLYAPSTAGGVNYTVTLVVNRTAQERLYVRGFEIQVYPGVPTVPGPIVPPLGYLGQHDYTDTRNAIIFVTGL